MTRFSALLSLGLAASACSALSVGTTTAGSSRGLNERSNAGFLSFPIEHGRRERPRVSRRQTDTGVPLFNVSFVSYLIELDIGTPPQAVRVAIDTGSDELWVNPDCNDPELLESQRRECRRNGIYSASRSSTSSVDKVVGPPTESIQYGIGSVEMTYITDNIALPNSDIKLESVQFAIATDTDDLNEGILGLSYGKDTNLVYSNLVDVLFEQNVTRSKAFSVALGSIDADNGGVLIFGGVDTKKFTGELMMNRIQGPQFRGDIHRYYLQLDSISLTRSGQSSSAPYPGSEAVVVLDTGASLSYFPDSVLRALARDLGGQYNSNIGLYLVPCSLLEDDGTIDFAFRNGTIKVPIRDMLLQDSGACALAADRELEGTGIEMLLGDSFLRSVYVVFDQTTETIGMAPYVNCGQNEQPLPASGAGGLRGECDANAANNEREDNAAGRPVASYTSAWVGAAVGLLGLFIM